MKAILKRRRIAARLAEDIRGRSVYRFDFICAGCGDMAEEAPIYSEWECGNCDNHFRLRLVAHG